MLSLETTSLNNLITMSNVILPETKYKLLKTDVLDFCFFVVSLSRRVRWSKILHEDVNYNRKYMTKIVVINLYLSSGLKRRVV